MIITQERSKEVISSHDFEQVNCTIDAEDMRYVASLLRNNYSNTRLAVVREISANALDANAEAGVTRPIEIKLPTAMNPPKPVVSIELTPYKVTANGESYVFLSVHLLNY